MQKMQMEHKKWITILKYVQEASAQKKQEKVTAILMSTWLICLPPHTHIYTEDPENLYTAISEGFLQGLG